METRSHKIIPTSEKKDIRQLHPISTSTAAISTAVSAKDEASSDSTYGSLEGRPLGPDTPTTRRRRARSSLSMEPNASGVRVAKRLDTGVRKSYPAAAARSSDDTISVTPGNRAFPCPLAIFGCTSTFGSKNEWKRHVNTQHMRLGFWRCDQCPTDGNRGPNDFNRKDLFIQHIRRMHSSSFRRSSAAKLGGKDDAEEQGLQDIAQRCYRHIRSPPEQSSCLFCEQSFHGIGSWDDRMEHVGRHMEVAKREGVSLIAPQEWKPDESTHGWLANEQIIAPHGEQWVLQDVEMQFQGASQNGAGPSPSGSRPPRQSIPGKRSSSSYHYVPLREAPQAPHTGPTERPTLAPAPPVQVAARPTDASPKMKESQSIGIVSGHNGMLPYMQEPIVDRHPDREVKHSPNGMVPPQRPLVECHRQGCSRRGMYGFASSEELAEHLRDAHRPETGQSSSRDFHTPPQLLPSGVTRVLHVREDNLGPPLQQGYQQSAFHAYSPHQQQQLLLQQHQHQQQHQEHHEQQHQQRQQQQYQEQHQKQQQHQHQQQGYQQLQQQHQLHPQHPQHPQHSQHSQHSQHPQHPQQQPPPQQPQRYSHYAEAQPDHAGPSERPAQTHMLANGHPIEIVSQRYGPSDRIDNMPPLQNGQTHNFSPTTARHAEHNGDAGAISDSRTEVEMVEREHEEDGEEEEEEEREGRHDEEEDGHDEDNEEVEILSPRRGPEEADQSSVQETPRVIGNFPRWRDAYGFKYCSTQDLAENDVYAMRERSQDLEMVLANVWQAFARTGHVDTHPMSPLTGLVRRFAPNILVTADQPGGLPYYPHQH